MLWKRTPDLGQHVTPHPQKHTAELAVVDASRVLDYADRRQAAAQSASGEIPLRHEWIGVILDVIWDVGAWILCPRHSR
jgi:hypothetical protein